MKKIVIASDSFKGCLSSAEVSQSAETAIHRIFPACNVVPITVADGGEGTVDAFVSSGNGCFVRTSVHNPLMEPIQAQYGISRDGQTAVIEMAAASGLTLIPVQKRNPLLTTSYGTGELIKDALSKGCSRIVMGIGGSATNDAGTGLLQALGYRFLDKQGRELTPNGENLRYIASIDESGKMPQLHQTEFIIACDVNNPFSGIEGAAHVFARQKGATDFMIHLLDEGLKNFAAVIRRDYHTEIENIRGAGAAGGMGGSCSVLLDAILKPGIELILDFIGFEQTIQNADLIITGEGRLDTQTGMGKTASGVLKAAQRQGIPVIAIGGSVENADYLNQLGFLAVLAIQQAPLSLADAMRPAVARNNIQQCIEQAMRIIRHFHIKR